MADDFACGWSTIALRHKKRKVKNGSKIVLYVSGGGVETKVIFGPIACLNFTLVVHFIERLEK
jgi:hypothetical protein